MRVWEERPFHEGDSLGVQEWAEILRRTDLIRITAQSVSLLSRSEHSRFLLRQKLLQREYPIQLLDTVLDALVADGSLSDERFAVGWVRGRLRSHPEGRSHLIAGLRSRGVDAALAERAVDEALADLDTSMVESARSFVERLTRSRTLAPTTIAERLYRRGFSRTVVRAIVEQLPEQDNDDERHLR